MPAVLIRTEGSGERALLVPDDETLVISEPLSWRLVAEVEDDEQGRAVVELLGKRAGSRKGARAAA